MASARFIPKKNQSSLWGQEIISKCVASTAQALVMVILRLDDCNTLHGAASGVSAGLPSSLSTFLCTVLCWGGCAAVGALS